MHTEPAVFQLTAKVSRQPFRLTQQSLQNNRQALLRTSRVGGANNRCNSTLTSLGTVQRSKSNATCFPIVRWEIFEATLSSGILVFGKRLPRRQLPATLPQQVPSPLQGRR